MSDWKGMPPWYSNDNYANTVDNVDESRNVSTLDFSESKFSYGNDDIDIKLLYMTDIESKEFKDSLSYMVAGTVGTPRPGDVERIYKEIYTGGLQHALENIVIIFSITGVSRAFTHQIVRHRKWKFHQQSLRWVHIPAGSIGFRLSPHVKNNPALQEAVEEHLRRAESLHELLTANGVPFQDARDILPISTKTHIVAETNLRDFIDAYSYRACSIVQQQMVYVMWKMRELILERFPDLSNYIQLSCEKSQRCTHQGWETVKGSCNLEWAGKGKFKSNTFSEK